MKEPLVSIIVPVFNVSQYLNQCLDSIIGQTYKSLEIILVDDGSTDKSGIICEKYQKKDKRIVVIHKKNGGLSDARNVGLDHANGKYINFVDSDDFIHKSQIELLVNSAIMQNVSLVICGYKKFMDGHEKTCDCTKELIYNSTLSQKYSAREAVLKMLYYKEIQMYSPGKLYDRALFKNLRFPKGKKFEDVPTTWSVIKQVNDVVYIDTPLYFYRQRRDSIINASYTHDKMDQVHMARAIMEEVVNDDELYKAAISKYFFCLADNYSQVNNKFITDKFYLEQELKKYGNIVKRDRNNNKSLRILAVLGDINVSFIRYAGKIYKQYKRAKLKIPVKY